MGWQKSFSLGPSKSRKGRKSTDQKVGKSLAAYAAPPVVFEEWRAPLGAACCDRYEIKDLIGAGSYGHVVEAKDSLAGGQLVAVKRIGRVFDDLIDCKRILREVTILRSLNHACIVKLRDICLPLDPWTFDEVNLVMEICHSDLKQLFRTPVTLSVAVTKTLLYNAMLGLHYVHSASIYHRDLKPANCLVNEDCTVKICDFGLARAMPATSSQPKTLRRQLTGHVVTRWYRAPELILLQPYYTAAVDVWSLGCIAAELFAMLKENRQNPAKRKPLFRGSSCFPLSPEHEIQPRAEREDKDQLSAIFGIIGTPSDDVIQQFPEETVRNYLSRFPVRDAQAFTDIFPGVDDDGLDLVTRLLSFVPDERITMAEAMSHPFVQSVRRKERELVHEGAEVVLPFESDPDLDEVKLRRYMLQEITRFHPDLKLDEIRETTED